MLIDAFGDQIPACEPLDQFASALLQGAIGALKGFGGYHLICDARDCSAVARLRHRKHREEKPFAVTVADVETAARLGAVGTAERGLLVSPRAPIVLLWKQRNLPISDEVAPGNPWLGVMLPYSTLHHLLMRTVGEIPLAMTSGNQTDEPIAYREDAVSRLAGITDLFLTHDRAIQPSLIAHGLHPDHASSHYARQRSRREGIELLNIQHHHAHLRQLHG